MQNQKPKESGPDGDDVTSGIAAVGAKAIDIALGVASLAVEVAGTAARYVVEKSPEWVDTLEERGRPVREQLTGAGKGHGGPQADSGSGDDEISALERRIRELEAQVVSSPVADVRAAEAKNAAAVSGVEPAGAEAEMAPLFPETPDAPAPVPVTPPAVIPATSVPFVAPDMDEPEEESPAPGESGGASGPRG
jgi:hypothetical protein